eukprot:4644200-Prymnesium_polylepis.1
MLARFARQPLRLMPGPPNFGLSRHAVHAPQSSPVAGVIDTDGGATGGAGMPGASEEADESLDDCDRRVAGGEKARPASSPSPIGGGLSGGSGCILGDLNPASCTALPGAPGGGGARGSVRTACLRPVQARAACRSAAYPFARATLLTDAFA